MRWLSWKRKRQAVSISPIDIGTIEGRKDNKSRMDENK